MSDLSNEAKYLLNNPAFVAAMDSARAQAMTAALACAVSDDDGRRRFLDAVRTVDKVTNHLAALMASEKPEDVNVVDFYAEQARKRWSDFLRLTS